MTHIQSGEHVVVTGFMFITIKFCLLKSLEFRAALAFLSDKSNNACHANVRTLRLAPPLRRPTNPAACDHSQ